MNQDQKQAARKAIRLWANGDPEPASAENPLAARHRFTEQSGGNGRAITAHGVQTRQSGGSKPVTELMNSYEYTRMKRIMELIHDQDPPLVDILDQWGTGSTFEEIASQRGYSKTEAHGRFTLGMNLVWMLLNASDQGILVLGGLKVRNAM